MCVCACVELLGEGRVDVGEDGEVAFVKGGIEDEAQEEGEKEGEGGVCECVVVARELCRVGTEAEEVEEEGEREDEEEVKEK